MGVVMSFMALPLGVGRKASPPPKFTGFINNSRGYFGGRGIAHLPSSSHSRDALLPRLRGLRRRKDWHLSLPPHNAGEYFGGGGTSPPPHSVREYLGGGRTGLLPHTVGVYFMHMAGNNDGTEHSAFPDVPCGTFRGRSSNLSEI